MVGGKAREAKSAVFSEVVESKGLEESSVEAGVMEVKMATTAEAAEAVDVVKAMGVTTVRE